MTDQNEPYYVEGESGVSHRNIDASGEAHPFGDSPKEWQADLRQLIKQVADDLYDSWQATVREYLANAETACLKVEQYLDDPDSSPYDSMAVRSNYEPRITVKWDRSKQKLIIQDNGIGMSGAEVDQVFRQVGRSATRDFGNMSGAFGMGVLSFFKFIGTGNSTMIMLSNSRLRDDNASYLVSLAGVEPIRGSLGATEYGTKFKLDQKRDDMDIREAVEQYAEYMRVPVLYRELDENGEEVFNEDWGDKNLYDSYTEDKYGDSISEPGLFEAYMSPEASGDTLLLSMDIERGGKDKYKSPYPFDVRLLDESGKVVESSNGNEGLIPVSRPEYNQMLLNARSDSIIESMLSNQDVTAYEMDDEYEPDYAVAKHVLESDKPLPVAEYVPIGEADKSDLGEQVVIIGPHQGRAVVDEREWRELSAGRAERFVPEDELESFDIDSGTGDLCLPKPTTDRSSLQSHQTFWKHIDNQFYEAFDSSVDEFQQFFEQSDDTMKAIREMESNTVNKMKQEL